MIYLIYSDDLLWRQIYCDEIDPSDCWWSTIAVGNCRLKPIFEYPANFANFEYLEFSAGFTKVYVDFNYDFYADDWEETFEGIHYPEIAHFSHLDCNMSPNYGKINLTLELSEILNDATKIIM